MKQSSLHRQHLSLGAQFYAVGDWEIPKQYGDPVQENLTVRNGVGIADLSLRGKIRVTGEDRVTWLQSIVSNDILPLTPGQGLYSTFMNHKGKILSYFRLFLLENSVFLEDVGEIGETTYHAFRKFLLYGTKAKMDNYVDRYGSLLICGPRALEVVEKTFSVDMQDVNLHALKTADFQGHHILIARTEETGEVDIELLMPVEAMVPAWEHIWLTGKPVGLQPVGRAALESLRIEAGIPKAGPDLNEEIVPPEANLEGKAFSLSKGCYPGQEVVARMDTYGSVKRRLVGLVLEGNDMAIPERRAKIFSGDREVGWVSSAAFSPTLHKTLAFGFPLRDFTQPDTTLTIEVHGKRCHALVRSLPFLSPASTSS